jgi:serine/threonine-protein kinase RsbW
MAPDGTRLALSLPGSAAGPSAAADAFDAFARSVPLTDEVRRDLQVVLDELLSNTVRHGEAGGREAAIDLAIAVETGWLVVEIVDDGPPFDPFSVALPDTTLPLDRRTPGGLGILFVRELVDEYAYDGAGGRNRVILRKRLGGREAALPAAGGETG